jgi:hypothetical protein
MDESAERIRETLALLNDQRPDDKAECRPQGNEVTFAFTDTRRRRYVIGVATRLMLRWNPKKIVSRLSSLTWHLVMGELNGSGIIPVLGVEGSWDFRLAGHRGLGW